MVHKVLFGSSADLLGSGTGQEMQLFKGIKDGAYGNYMTTCEIIKIKHLVKKGYKILYVVCENQFKKTLRNPMK